MPDKCLLIILRDLYCIPVKICYVSRIFQVSGMEALGRKESFACAKVGTTDQKINAVADGTERVRDI